MLRQFHSGLDTYEGDSLESEGRKGSAAEGSGQAGKKTSPEDSEGKDSRTVADITWTLDFCM